MGNLKSWIATTQVPKEQIKKVLAPEHQPPFPHDYRCNALLYNATKMIGKLL